MYLEHFGLQQHPFTLTPDTEFFLDYGEFKDGLEVLKCALSTGEGFTKVTGEAGTGKTLLCRMMMNSLDDSYVISYIPSPTSNPLALYIALAKDLGIGDYHDLGQSRLLEIVNGRLMDLHAEGRKVLLLVDEAQALSDEGIETLRLISNLETEKSKLVQLVLFGQPELDLRLRQLRQRILFDQRIQPLDPETLDVYLRHRLHVAGYRGVSLFNPRAFSLLHRGSGGIPRLVNVLAHKALLVAYGRGERAIDASHVRKAIADTDGMNVRRQRLAPATAFFGFLGLAPARVQTARH